MKTCFLLLGINILVIAKPTFTMNTFKQQEPKVSCKSLTALCLATLYTKRKPPHQSQFTFDQMRTLQDVITLQYAKTDFDCYYKLLNLFNVCNVRAKVEFFAKEAARNERG